jgi:hypothetical protein
MVDVNETYRTPLTFTTTVDDAHAAIENAAVHSDEADPNEVEIEVVREEPAGQYVDTSEDQEDLAEKYETLKAERDSAYQVANAANARSQAHDQLWELGAHQQTIAAAIHEQESLLEQDRARKRAAIENFDTDAQVAIDEVIQERKAYLQQLTGGYHAISEQAKAILPRAQQYQQQPQPQQVDQFAAAIAGYSESDRRWLMEHRADLEGNQERVNKLIAVANYATAGAGLTAGSEEFYDFLSDQMGYSQEPAPRKQSRQQGGASRRMVAAPSSRSTGRSPKSSVFLNEFDLKTAKELRISPEDYARNYKAKAHEGQLGREATGGRLHAQYVSGSFEDHY